MWCWGHYGTSGGVGCARGVLGACRDSRYTGTRRGIGSIRSHFRVPRGVGAIWGTSGVY